METFRRRTRTIGPIGTLVVVSTSLLATAASAQTTLVSVTQGGVQGNAASGPSAAMSRDGRFVVFASAATNLIAGDTNASVDVFLKDRQSGEIIRVSVAPDGLERTGDSGVEGVAVSDDGNVVAFTSRAALLSDDTNTCPETAASGTGPSCPDIYILRRTPAPVLLVRASVGAGAAIANGPSRQPVLNGPGTIIAFTSSATNLIPGDTNEVSDVFVRTVALGDVARASVSSASASSASVQGDRASHSPAISDDGLTVAFLSDATNFSDVPDPASCAQPACTRGFVRAMAAGTTVRLSAEVRLFPHALQVVVGVAISADGRFVASSVDYVSFPNSILAGGTMAIVYDRAADRVARLLQGGHGASVALSGDGRYAALGPGTAHFRPPAPLPDPIPGAITDRFMNVPVSLEGTQHPGTVLDLSADGRLVLVSQTADIAGASDSNGVADVFVLDLDRDDDGMPDKWETLYGLNPDSAADGGADPDGDGQTNVQEYQANGHPNGTFKRYLAEGARNAFFTTTLSLLNPDAASPIATVLLRYLGDAGTETAQILGLPGHSLVPFQPSVDTAENFSTVIESDRPIVADRSMRWGEGLSAGSHAEAAIEAPSAVWYLAEGATHGAFDLFYLLQNANAQDAHVTIEYLRPAPFAPVTRSYVVSARSRRTIWVDVEGPELEATDVSARITSDRPIIVERSMYFSRPDLPFVAGHAGAGVTAPATQWFLAEGATGAFFDLYVLIANPGDTEATLDVTYLLPSGAPVVKPYTVAPRSRRTISVEGEDPRLADTAVSTLVTSTNGQPVIVERAMWWPFSNWHESHLSAGTTTTGTRWAFANGSVFAGDAEVSTETYVLIANTSNRAGTATVRLFPNGEPTRETVVSLPPNSRVNVRIAEAFPGLSLIAFGAVIESDGVALVVEHARYDTESGVVWTKGEAALATKLP